MSNLSPIKTIEAWGLDLGKRFGTSRNISLEDRVEAFHSLIDYMKKEFSWTREDFEMYDHKIIKECIPVDKEKKKQMGIKFAAHSVRQFYEVLNDHFGPKEIDLDSLIERSCKNNGITFKKRETEKGPGLFDKNRPKISVEIEKKKILEEKLLVIDRKKYEEEYLPIDPEIKKMFGLNDRGEFDI